MSDSEPKDDFPRGPAVVGLILSALPMVVYPFVMMANLMSIVAEPDPRATALLRFASTSFLTLSSAYPLAWIGCLIGTVVLLTKQRRRQATWIAFVPILYLALVAGAWWMWAVAA